MKVDLVKDFANVWFNVCEDSEVEACSDKVVEILVKYGLTFKECFAVLYQLFLDVQSMYPAPHVK